MKWYIAKIVFHILTGENDQSTSFDEQLWLIEATDKKEAFYKAKKIGINNQDSFLNVQMLSVKWNFINVAEVKELNALTDGKEIYSQIREYGDAGKHTNFIHEKAARIINFNNPQPV
jgi:uncharacterized protein DUF4288